MNIRLSIFLEWGDGKFTDLHFGADGCGWQPDEGMALALGPESDPSSWTLRLHNVRFFLEFKLWSACAELEAGREFSKESQDRWRTAIEAAMLRSGWRPWSGNYEDALERLNQPRP